MGLVLSVALLAGLPGPTVARADELPSACDVEADPSTAFVTEVPKDDQTTVSIGCVRDAATERCKTFWDDNSCGLRPFLQDGNDLMMIVTFHGHGKADEDYVSQVYDDIQRAQNEGQSLGVYLRARAQQYDPQLFHSPTDDVDLQGRALKSGNSLIIVVPRSEIGTVANWWQKALSTLVGLAAGALLGAGCLISFNVGAPAAGPICAALSGFGTGVVSELLNAYFDGRSLNDGEVWAEAMAVGVCGAIGGALVGKLLTWTEVNGQPLFAKLQTMLLTLAKKLWFGDSALTALAQGFNPFFPAFLRTIARIAGGVGANLHVMVVGDSISNGFEGNHTWRHRLWEWAQNQKWPATFVGPLSGTKKPDDPHPPIPPPLGEDEKAPHAEPDPAQFQGAYAEDVKDGFVNGGSAHYAMWGRQLGQNVHTIKPVMDELKAKQQLPDVLLVELGFNDIGWRGAGAGLVDTMKDFIDQARAANPNVHLVLANVPHRTTLGDANPQLPQRTTDYNTALAKAIPTWSTAASAILLADIDQALGCDPNATTCATTYDGLHPNTLGEYRIAQAFGTALHKEFGIGSELPKAPHTVSTQPVETPTGLEFDGTQQGVTVTWPKVFGAHSYDIQWRDITTDTAATWQQTILAAQTNRWDLSWQFTNQPHDGHTYQVRVRAVTGDSDDYKSPWSAPVTGVAHPTTAPPPATINASAGAGSIDVTWTPPTGPHTDTITRYALWIYDEDTPTVHSRIIGYPPSARTAHVTGLTPGHHYRVFMATWNAAGEGKPRIADTVIPQ
ncbi:GDSL-type esterase/lipase family protein [Streptomyces sp. NPDC002870]|uniref:GDSL-type esterase/lipase family protein n=1 Tax=Streptomyces sp. NPDC002870 TaxID=3364666 RepID=UPI0036814FD4